MHQNQELQEVIDVLPSGLSTNVSQNHSIHTQHQLLIQQQQSSQQISSQSQGSSPQSNVNPSDITAFDLAMRNLDPAMMAKLSLGIAISNPVSMDRFPSGMVMSVHNTRQNSDPRQVFHSPDTSPSIQTGFMSPSQPKSTQRRMMMTPSTPQGLGLISRPPEQAHQQVSMQHEQSELVFQQRSMMHHTPSRSSINHHVSSEVTLPSPAPSSPLDNVNGSFFAMYQSQSLTSTPGRASVGTQLQSAMSPIQSFSSTIDQYGDWGRDEEISTPRGRKRLRRDTSEDDNLMIDQHVSSNMSASTVGEMRSQLQLLQSSPAKDPYTTLGNNNLESPVKCSLSTTSPTTLEGKQERNSNCPDLNNFDVLSEHMDGKFSIPAGLFRESDDMSDIHQNMNDGASDLSSVRSTPSISTKTLQSSGSTSVTSTSKPRPISTRRLSESTRANRIASEQRRRADITRSTDALKNALPPHISKLPKAMMFEKTVEYIKFLEQQNELNEKRMQMAEAEIQRLGMENTQLKETQLTMLKNLQKQVATHSEVNSGGNEALGSRQQRQSHNSPGMVDESQLKSPLKSEQERKVNLTDHQNRRTLRRRKQPSKPI